MPKLSKQMVGGTYITITLAVSATRPATPVVAKYHQGSVGSVVESDATTMRHQVPLSQFSPIGVVRQSTRQQDIIGPLMRLLCSVKKTRRHSKIRSKPRVIYILR